MKVLVIGYGNTLRGDDGVGYRIAEQVEAWGWPQVETIACHQLTPELAAAIAACDRVIFIDATLPGAQTAVTVRSLSPANPTSSLDGHRSSPVDLLHLTAHLYGAEPEAFHLLLPTAKMAFGETLSAIAQAGMTAALAQLPQLLKAKHGLSRE